MKESQITCPECGVKMNKHCEKLIVSPRPGESRASRDPDLLGVPQEVYNCPECGKEEFRRAN